MFGYGYIITDPNNPTPADYRYAWAILSQQTVPVKKTGLPAEVENYTTWIRCNGGYCQNGKPTPRVQVSDTQTVSDMQADLLRQGWIRDSIQDLYYCPDCVHLCTKSQEM